MASQARRRGGRPSSASAATRTDAQLRTDLQIWDHHPALRAFRSGERFEALPEDGVAVVNADDRYHDDFVRRTPARNVVRCSEPASRRSVVEASPTR